MDFGISVYLIAPALAWVAAQVFKYVIASIKAKNLRQFRQFYLSGNMPSAHSATVVSLAVIVGFMDGIDSAIFAVTAVFAAVVMYDAVMVRRSSGEQGAALLQLFLDTKSTIKPPHVAKGHTPLEVAVGALVGLTVGFIVILIQLAY